MRRRTVASELRRAHFHASCWTGQPQAGGKDLVTPMTTHLAKQEHTGRRAPAAEEQPEGLSRVGLAIDLSIERCSDPGAGKICEKNAAWPHRLRRILRASLSHWRPSSMVETAELLLTELVTNAFLHADAPTVGVRVYRRGNLLMIEVSDGTPQNPMPSPASLLSEHGRGLALVDALADSWGVSGDRTTTWCSLSLPAPPPPRRPPPLWRSRRYAGRGSYSSPAVPPP